jgi:hypothetical protein
LREKLTIFSLTEPGLEPKTELFSSSNYDTELPRELNQLLYSPPQSEADSDGSGGLFDISSLLAADIKTPEGIGGGGRSNDLMHQPPPMAIQQQRQEGEAGYGCSYPAIEQLNGAPYPDWQLTPPPENHHHIIKEEELW